MHSFQDNPNTALHPHLFLFVSYAHPVTVALILSLIHLKIEMQLLDAHAIALFHPHGRTKKNQAASHSLVEDYYYLVKTRVPPPYEEILLLLVLLFSVPSP